MAIKINRSLTPQKLVPKITGSSSCLRRRSEHREDVEPGEGHAGVHGQRQIHHARMDEWTQGFSLGLPAAIRCTGEKKFLNIGRSKTVELMATHVSHVGVHDHGFTIFRLMAICCG